MSRYGRVGTWRQRGCVFRETLHLQQADLDFKHSTLTGARDQVQEVSGRCRFMPAAARRLRAAEGRPRSRPAPTRSYSSVLPHCGGRPLVPARTVHHTFDVLRARSLVSAWRTSPTKNPWICATPSSAGRCCAASKRTGLDHVADAIATDVGRTAESFLTPTGIVTAIPELRDRLRRFSRFSSGGPPMKQSLQALFANLVSQEFFLDSL